MHERKEHSEKHEYSGIPYEHLPNFTDIEREESDSEEKYTESYEPDRYEQR